MRHRHRAVASVRLIAQAQLAEGIVTPALRRAALENGASVILAGINAGRATIRPEVHAVVSERIDAGRPAQLPGAVIAPAANGSWAEQGAGVL